MATKGEYIEAIKDNLSFEELSKVVSTKCPKGTYYNYETIRAMLIKKRNNEIEDNYFSIWLTIVCWALSAEDYKYEEMSWEFDGASFIDALTTNDIVCLIKTLDDFNYRYTHKDFIYGHQKEELNICIKNIYYRLK